MTIAVIAIVISIISVIFAGLSLGWNIYRDIVLKARIRIDFGVSVVLQQGISSKSTYVSITATNHGPGSVNLSMVKMKDSSWWRWLLHKEKWAIVIHCMSSKPFAPFLMCDSAVCNVVDLAL